MRYRLQATPKVDEFTRSCHPYAESTHKVRNSVSQVALSRMQITLHATRRRPHHAPRMVHAMAAWSVNTASSRHCRNATSSFFKNHHFAFQLNSQEVLPSTTFWTSRGHRCLPFSPSACAFIYYRALASPFPSFIFSRSSIFIEFMGMRLRLRA